VTLPPLTLIAIEGAVDRFCGRPQDQNPYSFEFAYEYYVAWELGWVDAGELLEMRGEKEARRWLTAGEAA